MGKGKRYKVDGKRYKNTNGKISRKIRKISKCVFIIAIVFIAFYIFDNYKEQQETHNLLDSVEISNETDIVEDLEFEQQETEEMLKVRELKKEYPELIGWIRIDGTNIDYPVMQGTDNEFYIRHDYKKEYSQRGAIFLDKDYDWTIPSSNLLLYGHNINNDGTMFSDLLNYQEKSFYDAHQNVRFITENDDSEYEIISAFFSRVYYQNEQNVFRYYYFINAENEEQYNEYVNNAKAASLYDTEKTAEYGDQLLTLSTCEYSQQDGRFAVVARKKK